MAFATDDLPDHSELDPDLLAPREDRSAEIRLFRAVIAQAWNDAFIAPDGWLCSSSGGAPKADDAKAEKADLIRAEARRWLIADYGDDAEDREEICEAAGLDAGQLRGAALRRIEMERRGEVERPGAHRVEVSAPTAEVVSLDDMFAKLLARESKIDSATLDALLAELARLEAEAA